MFFPSDRLTDDELTLLEELIKNTPKIEHELRGSLSYRSREALSVLVDMRREVYVLLSNPETLAELAQAAPELVAEATEYWQTKKSTPEEKTLQRVTGGSPLKKYTNALKTAAKALNAALSQAAENEALNSAAPDFMEMVVRLAEATEEAKNANRALELVKQAPLSLKELPTWKNWYSDHVVKTPDDVSQLRLDILMSYQAFISTLGKTDDCHLTVGEQMLLETFTTGKATVEQLKEQVVDFAIQATKHAEDVRSNGARRDKHMFLKKVNQTVIPLEELMRVGEIPPKDVPAIRATIYEGYNAVRIARQFIAEREASQAS